MGEEAEVCNLDEKRAQGVLFLFFLSLSLLDKRLPGRQYFVNSGMME
jgi:hypothetical protein